MEPLKNREITSVLFPSSVNYTDQMYKGNRPTGEASVGEFVGDEFHHGILYRYEHGEASVFDNTVVTANITVRDGYDVSIVGKYVRLFKLTTAGDFNTSKACELDIETNEFEHKAGKEFSAKEISYFTKPEPEDSYITVKVKERVKESILAYGDFYKEQNGFNPPYFKAWILDNEHKESDKMIKTQISPVDAYDYFNKNKSELENKMHLISENDNSDTEIYLTSENGKPSIVVLFKDEPLVERETENSATELSFEITRLMNTFIYPSPEVILANVLEYFPTSEDEDIDEDINNEPTAEEQDDILKEYQDGLIIDTEDALSLATNDFVSAVTNSPMSLIDDLDIEQVKDRLCEVLSKEFNLEVFRPMYLRYEDGTVEFKEYPYEDLD